MNKEVIVSVVKKALAIVVPMLVGSGKLDEAVGQQIPALVDAVIIILSIVPTIISSFKTHSKEVK